MLKEYLFELRKKDFQKREKLDKEILKKIKSNIKNAYENVPFYKEKFQKTNLNPEDIKTLEDFQKIPITYKNELKTWNLSYISKNYNIENLYKSHTSGSTGEPFISYFDNKTWHKVKLAGKMRSKFACGLKIFEKIAIIDTEEADYESPKDNKNSLSKKFIKKKKFSLLGNEEKHVKEFLEYKPSTIYGIPSYFVNLSYYMEENNIKFNFIKRIFTSSELLDNLSKKRIEKIFNCKVYDIYGCTEVKEIAWECPKQEGYHINEDLVYVEILDDHGNPVKKGHLGNIVISSLENPVMPLIRYYTGDSGKFLNHECSCGRTFKLMKPTYGRKIDYFIMENGQKFSPYEVSSYLEDLEEIIKYQIIQKTKKSAILKLMISKDFSKETEKQILKDFKNILGDDFKINIEYLEKFPKTKKFKSIISEVER